VDPELPTFASVLHDNGWITLGFANVGVNGNPEMDAIRSFSSMPS
jgi:hypothetical protein